MNREIKFRGLTREGTWEYGNLLKSEVNTIGEYFVEIAHPFADCTNVGAYPVMAGTEGQFTGLLDKNGVEIYEGDIVQIVADNFDLENAGHEVVFGTHNVGEDSWGIEYTPTGFLIEYKDGSGYCNIPSECLVLGNKFEQPHLLGKENQTNG